MLDWCWKFSYCLDDFSWSLEDEPAVGTWLSSRLMIAWVMSSLQVRPVQPQGDRNVSHDWLSLAAEVKAHCKRDPPCTIRSLRTSCSLCRTGTDTWYWTGSWWGVWHCPNKPSAQEQTNTKVHKINIMSCNMINKTRHTFQLHKLCLSVIYTFLILNTWKFYLLGPHCLILKGHKQNKKTEISKNCFLFR